MLLTNSRPSSTRLHNTSNTVAKINGIRISASLLIGLSAKLAFGVFLASQYAIFFMQSFTAERYAHYAPVASNTTGVSYVPLAGNATGGFE